MIRAIELIAFIGIPLAVALWAEISGARDEVERRIQYLNLLRDSDPEPDEYCRIVKAQRLYDGSFSDDS